MLNTNAAGRHDRLAQVPWGAVGLYIVIAFGLAWLVALPLWIGDQQDPGFAALFQVLAGAMMFAPAIATLVVVFAARTPRQHRARFLGLWPLRSRSTRSWSRF